MLALEADLRLYDTVRNRSDLVNLLLPSDHEKLWHALPTTVLSRLNGAGSV